MKKTTPPTPEADFLSEKQRQILNIIADHQLARREDISGRRLRAQLPESSREETDALIQSLIGLIVRTRLDDETYKLKFWGWIFSNRRSQVCQLIDGVLRLLHTKYTEDPDFRTYTWSELTDIGAVAKDPDPYFVREVLSDSWLTQGEHEGQWRTPRDVEDLQRLRGFREFLTYRARLQAKYFADAAQMQAKYESLAALVDSEPPVVLHHHGDVIMGSTFNTNITGSTVGAVAVGDHAAATGTVHVGATGFVTQAQHEEHVRKARKALVDDEGKLDELVHEALTQFLTLARKIQVEQQSLAETQAKMKATLDEVWAAQVAKGMKPEVLPKTLEVVKALMENPVMGEVVEELVGE